MKTMTKKVTIEGVCNAQIVLNNNFCMIGCILNELMCIGL